MTAREALLATAERMFAENGIDTASLREITRAAGQRNVTALQYHFGDRRGLLHAVLAHHVVGLSDLIHARLDALEGDAVAGARPMVEAFVEPLFEVAATPRGGYFVQVAAEVIGRATHSPDDDSDPLSILVDDPQGAVQRWARCLDAIMAAEVNGGPLHQRFAMLRLAYIEVARRSRHLGKPELADVFRSHVVDLLTAIALAPPSPRTLAALRKFQELSR